MEFLSNYDIMSMDSDDIVPQDIKRELNEFHKIYPPPSKEEILLMSEAVSSMEGHWGKDGFQFALNRILEIHDRFELYHKMLDEMSNEGKTEDEPPVEFIVGKMSPTNGLNNSDKDSTNEQEEDQVQSSDANRYHDVFLPRCMSEPSTQLPRRRGSGIQLSVMDIDRTAHQALTLLEETDVKARKLSKPSLDDACSPDNPNCMSLLEFLDDLSNSSGKNHLNVEVPMRLRTQSVPDETDGPDGLKRSKSLKALKRNTLIRKVNY